MSMLLGGIGLAKAEFRIISEKGTDTIAVHFNPTEYKISTSAELVENNGINIDSNDKIQNTGIINTTFSTKLILDTYESGESVRDYIKKLELAMGDKDNPDKPIPKCKFVWGELVAKGVLTSLSQKYTMFSEKGIPLRASVDIKLEDKPPKPGEPIVETNIVKPTFDIIIDGTNTNEKGVVIESINVETSIKKADSFEFKVSNAFEYEELRFKWVEDFFTPGKPIEIKMGYDKENKTVFEGFITLVSFAYSDKGQAMVNVSGMDASIKLMKGKKSFSWEKKKYSDVVSEIAKQYSLKTVIDATEIEYEKVEQDRMTNYKFILTLAQQSNFEFFVKGKQLYFRKPHKDKNSVIELDLKKDSISFEVNHDLGDQIDTVVVRGRDHKNQKEFEGKAESIEKIGSGKDGATLLRELVGAKTTEYIYTTETSNDSAQKRAKQILDSIAMKLVSGRGEWLGNPDILSGKYMKLKGAGENLDKLYYVISSKHSMKVDGYFTTFEFGGNDI